MIWLVVRLTVRGGREALTRLVVIAAAVALGVVLLLTALASYSALHAQDARTGWLQTSTHNHQPSISEATSDPLWWLKTHDEFGGQPIQRIDLAATGPHSPIPPGIAALPAPGQFYASPALAALLARTPPDQLGNRYPGHQVGVIGHAGLASPDDLIIMIGDSARHLAGQPGSTAVRSIETAPTPHSLSTFQQVGLALGAAGLLFPILTLVAMATRIAAARREQRLAAMRLVGATIGQVALLAAVEAAAAAFAGAIAGTGLFYLLRPPLARLRVTGVRWYAADINPSTITIAVVCLAVPLAAAAAATTTLRRVQLSPLAVVRRLTPAAPNIKRLIPLGLGVFTLAIFALSGRTYSRGASDSYAPTIVAGFVLIMIGIIAAGPWLTMACTRLLALRSGRAATLIATRRLADNPAAAFRAVSGLILAVFIGTVFVAGTATAASGTALGDDPAAATTVIARPTGAPLPAITAATLSTALRSQHGVRALTLIRSYAGSDVNGFPQGLLACGELSGTPEIGRCDPATQVAIMPLYSLDAGHTQPQQHWPAAHNAPNNLTPLPVQAVVIATDGTPAALERIRTKVDTIAPRRVTVPQTLGQLSAASIRDATQLQHLGDLTILISVILAGCSLAVAVAGSLVERKRPFALLRLTGMPIRSLRRVVLLEAAVPLIGLTISSAAAGLLTAELLLRALRSATIRTPGLPYYLTVLAGIAIALALVSCRQSLWEVGCGTLSYASCPLGIAGRGP